MHYTKPSASRLLQLMEQQIVILDGAMGTMTFPSFLIAIFSFPDKTEAVSYTHLTLPTKA